LAFFNFPLPRLKIVVVLVGVPDLAFTSHFITTEIFRSINIALLFPALFSARPLLIFSALHPVTVPDSTLASCFFVSVEFRMIKPNPGISHIIPVGKVGKPISSVFSPDKFVVENWTAVCLIVTICLASALFGVAGVNAKSGFVLPVAILGIDITFASFVSPISTISPILAYPVATFGLFHFPCIFIVLEARPIRN
jgi:hypothetical protein